MALLFMDSFDHYQTADLGEKYSNVDAGVIGAYGRNGTNGLFLSSHGYVLAGVIPSLASGVMGFAVKSVGPSQEFCRVFDAVGDRIQLAFGVMADGGVYVSTQSTYSGPDGSLTGRNLLGNSAPGFYSFNAWHYVEVKWTISSTVGAVTIRVDGVVALALTNVDTQSSGNAFATSAMLVNSTTNDQYFDDFYVLSNLGGVNDDFLGDVAVTALLPNGAGTTSGWTPSAGSNYQNVDEASPNDDTDYNATATLNAKDTYAMQDCAAGADIRGVQILASVKKAIEGPGKVKLVTRSSSTDYDGTEIAIPSTTYSYVREIRETDPATAAAWSESGWNAVEIGLKKTG